MAWQCHSIPPEIEQIKVHNTLCTPMISGDILYFNIVKLLECGHGYGAQIGMWLHKIFDFHNVTRHDTKYKNFLIEKFPKSKHVISTGKLYCDQESIYCPNIPTFITILTWVQGNKLIVLKNMNNRRSTLYLQSKLNYFRFIIFPIPYVATWTLFSGGLWSF